MKITPVAFNQGIQNPPKLGTVILKPTAEGKASYAQNIDVSNDEYGNGAVVPGPGLSTIGNNSELTGVPIIRHFYEESSAPLGYLWFGQGALGTKTILRRVKDVVSGSTPTIDTTGSITASHAGHANPTLMDMVGRPQAGNDYIYVAIKDDSDVTVQSFRADLTSPSLSTIATVSGWTNSLTDPILVFSTFDNNIYLIGQNRVDSINTSNVHSTNALSLGLPTGTYASAAVDWQQNLVVAYTTGNYGDFGRRKQGSRSGIATWDYVSPGIIRNVPAPCRYISALIPSPDGQLLVFGGVDQGKSSIYTFTGYGFQHLMSYIGDLPRSRHSVEFDGQGRILWQTADGQLCRYDKLTGIFEHLGSITTGSSAGGILAKGIGSPSGNEFFVASGSGSTYTMKKVQFGTYIGDGGGDDAVTTPQVFSGTQTLKQGSTISEITLPLAKPLATGEKVELRVYKNGSTSDYDTYLTMDASVATDLGKSSKREVKTLDNINSYNLAVVWKQADGLTTAPPVLPALVGIEETN